MTKGKASQVVKNFARDITGADESASVNRTGGFLHLKAGRKRNFLNSDHNVVAIRVLNFIFFDDNALLGSPLRAMLTKENAIPIAAEQFSEARNILARLRRDIGKIIDSPNNFMAFAPAQFNPHAKIINGHGDQLRGLGIEWPVVKTGHDLFRLYFEWLENNRYGYALFCRDMNLTNYGLHKEIEARGIEIFKVRPPWLLLREAHDAVLFTLGNDGVAAYTI